MVKVPEHLMEEYYDITGFNRMSKEIRNVVEKVGKELGL